MTKNMTRYLFLLPILCMAAILNAQDIALPTDYLSTDFHKSRRQAFKEKLPPNSVAVLFANPVRNRANDVDYIYHQDPNFYYLTGYKEPHSMVILFSEPQTDSEGNEYDEILFAQSRNAREEMWTGRRLGPERAKEVLDVAHVMDHSEFKDADINFSSFDKIWFPQFYNDVRDTPNEADLFDLIQQFKSKAAIPEDFNPRKHAIYQQIRESTPDFYQNLAEQIFRMSRWDPGLNDDPVIQGFINAGTTEGRKKIAASIPESNLDPQGLTNVMKQLREIKSGEELKLLRKAVSISCVGQIEVMKAMRPEMSETEIQGIHEFVFKKYGAEYEGYPSIVGAGYNGCILHYIENNRPSVDGDLVLMDLGAEYHGYTADVTRTIPANGKFTEEQKLIYNIVLEAQDAGIAASQPGNSMRAPHQAAKEVIDRRLAELGIIEAGASHNYFPHGTSHYVGLDVHDPGTGGPLQAGSVITVEPGIYIPAGSPCDEKWWNIAVRIEDDILITETGNENLSALAPRTVEAIEQMMAQKSVLENLALPDLDNK